jgi:hypothetical protein
MKYAKWYFLLISRAQARGGDVVGERHHIVPRTLDGSNEKSNLVKLTHREHFLAHWLLVKFTCGEDQRKMNLAFYRMSAASSKNSRPTLNSWQYARAKLAFVDAIKGKPTWNKGKLLTEEHKARISAFMKGKKRAPFTDEHKAKMGAAMKGKKHTAETKVKIGAAHLGKKMSPEARAKISAAHKGKPAWNNGKKHTAESRAKMSEACKSRRKGDLHV